MLAKAGHSIIVNYHTNSDAAHEVVAAITEAGGKALSVKADVAKEADIIRLFKAADDVGPLALLINNAGVVDLPQRIDEMSAERLTRMMNINVVGSILCAKEAVRRMSSAHGGQGRRHRQPVICGSAAWQPRRIC